MSKRRSLGLRLGALVSVCLGPPVLAQETEIQNWTAAPYWAPRNSADQQDTRPPRERTAEDRQALAVGPTALPFISLFPCRLVDTRGNAPLTGGFLPSATVRSYTLTGVCNVPANAQAISLNATVTNTAGPGFLTLLPQGGVFPPVSTLNYLGSDTIVNAAVVPLSATGGISMALGVSGGDVILDTNGYYAPAPSVTSLNARTGDLSLAAGSNVTITPSGQTLTIASTGGAGGAPTGPAGGSLAGTYPNPGIATGAVGTAQLADNGVTAPKIASAQVVKSVNGLKDAVTVVGGGATTVSTASGTITVSSPAAAVPSGAFMLGRPGDTTLIGAGFTEIAPDQADFWTATTTTGAPTARFAHTAVWTGSKMIVWGGQDFGGFDVNTGGQYDPAGNSWTATATAGTPTGRSQHTAVWTGSKMIVWGGVDVSYYYVNTGGQYDPVGNTWAPTMSTFAPTGRVLHTAVWTGSKMIVWGGQDFGGYVNTGGLYDPGADTWLTTTTAGAPTARFAHTAVWTGSKMIVWGGSDASNFLNTGGQYDPAANSWTATATTGAPTGRSDHTAAWTGSKMIVWGGVGGGGYANTGGLYDPAANSWTATATTGAPTGRWLHTAAWTGSKMIVWGGVVVGGYANTGGQWSTLSLYVKN